MDWEENRTKVIDIEALFEIERAFSITSALKNKINFWLYCTIQGFLKRNTVKHNDRFKWYTSRFFVMCVGILMLSGNKENSHRVPRSWQSTFEITQSTYKTFYLSSWSGNDCTFMNTKGWSRMSCSVHINQKKKTEKWKK